MKKKFLFGLLATTLVGASTVLLNAASDRVAIVSETAGIKALDANGTTLLNTIDKDKTNLVDGKVAIDISIDNSNDVRVLIYDDIDGSAASEEVLEALEAKRTAIVNALKDKAEVVVVNAYENIEDAADFFSESQDGRGVYLAYLTDTFVSFAKEISNTSVEYDTEIIPALYEAGATALAYYITDGLSEEDAASLTAVATSVFGADKIVEIADVDDVDTIIFDEVVFGGFKTAKTDLETEILLDDYIVNNFEIKDLKVSKGDITYDEENKKIVASKVDLGSNEDYKITYNLQIKSKVDETLIDMELRTNKQVNVTFKDGATTNETHLPETNKIDDDKCSPYIKILKEAFDNPYTGVYSYVIAGSVMLAVALISLVVLNKKKYEL